MSPDYGIAAASSYSRYQEQLKILNAMDFDDLIFYTVQLLESQADVREKYNFQFRHILVDEYQDTNAAQFKILRLLTERHQNLCVVGDDDQSIYGWRGADPSHILEFGRHYPSAQMIALEQNYRSTSRILEAANSVIAQNRNRYPKKLWSDRGVGEAITEVILEEDRAEAEFVAKEIFKNGQEKNRPWSDFAILYRSNSQSRVFEEALRRHTIPYKIVGGLSFLARKEVKDVLACWRLIVNPKDDASLRRIINWPARGVGRTTLEALGTYAFEKKQSLFEVMGQSSVLNPLVPKKSGVILEFWALMTRLGRSLTELPAEAEAVVTWAKDSLQQLQARQAVEDDCDDAVQAVKKWENVEELLHSIGQFSVEGEAQTGRQFFSEFLNRMSLEAQEAEKDEEQKDDSKKNQVTLLTLHGAKGLEYPVVYMVGVEEGFLPHKRTIDEAVDFGEERRLCYVGITRAKDMLFLTRVKNRIRYGKPMPRTPSRFLTDIPKDLIVRQDESDIPDPTSKEQQVEHESRIKNYLAEIRANLMKRPSG